MAKTQNNTFGTVVLLWLAISGALLFGISIGLDIGAPDISLATHTNLIPTHKPGACDPIARKSYEIGCNHLAHKSCFNRYKNYHNLSTACSQSVYSQCKDAAEDFRAEEFFKEYK